MKLGRIIAVVLISAVPGWGQAAEMFRGAASVDALIAAPWRDGHAVVSAWAVSALRWIAANESRRLASKRFPSCPCAPAGPRVKAVDLRRARDSGRRHVEVVVHLRDGASGPAPHSHRDRLQYSESIEALGKRDRF